MSRTLKGGILLILAGFFLLFSQLGLVQGDLFVYILAIGFIAAYVLLGARKIYGNVGFLIPGAILLAIAVFNSIEASIDGEVNPATFFIALSLSFLTVFLVHTFWFKEEDHGARFWPLYPSGALLLFAALIALISRVEWLGEMGIFNYIWVVVLIGAGIWLVVRALKKGKG